MLADPLEKREGHRRDFLAALDRRAVPRLSTLLVRDGYPEGYQMAAFYGQSLSLVEFLTARKGSLTFQRFLAIGAKDGYDRAIADIYGIPSMNELERLWLASLNRREMR
jgi:hypothetical protein